MSALKLFLASSGQRTLLAEALQTKLQEAARRASLKLDVVPWFRDGTFPLGSDVLTSLIENCRGTDQVAPSDFFAVLLTKDDDIIKKGEKGQSPRDNCIFELGFFMGGLGFEPARCFMVSSVGEGIMPSDVKGRTYVGIEEPADPTNPEQCAAAVEVAANLIRDRIRVLQGYSRPEFAPIAAEQILSHEKPDSADGDLLDESEIVLTLAAPFDRSGAAASQVLKNMKAGIRYRCFVRDLSAMDLCRFLWSVATADAPATEPDSPGQFGAIQANLRVMRENLSINVNPGQGSLEYVIHNATHADRALCYLRLPSQNKFLVFAKFQQATEITRQLTSVALPDEDLETPFIFRPTKYFASAAPENAEQLKRLRKALKNKFDPSLHGVMENACFGPQDSGLAST